jgi:DNA-binding transcriptional ArsR family regulator
VARPDAVFRALADPTRREIIKLLRKKEMTSGDIAGHFESAWPTISRHLAVLKDAGLISAERNGNSIHYELNTTVLQDIAEHLMDWTRPGGTRA